MLTAGMREDTEDRQEYAANRKEESSLDDHNHFAGRDLDLCCALTEPDAVDREAVRQSAAGAAGVDHPVDPLHVRIHLF